MVKKNKIKMHKKRDIMSYLMKKHLEITVAKNTEQLWHLDS